MRRITVDSHPDDATWRAALRGRVLVPDLPSDATEFANDPLASWLETTFGLTNDETGRLVRVLPEWELEPATAWAVLPGRRLLPAKTRVFLEMLNEALAPDAPLPIACKAHHERLGLPTEAPARERSTEA